MSASLSITAYSGKDSKEFQKHFKAVQFCIENELSFPKETSDFFKGRVDGGDLEDYQPKYILPMIANGVTVPLTIGGDGYIQRIKVADIPKEVDEIVVKINW